MRVSPKVCAAMLLIEVCEKVGLEVPSYAKSLVHGSSYEGSDRVESELLTILNDMDIKQRDQLLNESRPIALWYYLYSKAENSRDVESPMLTGNFDAEGLRNQRELFPEQPRNVEPIPHIGFLRGAR